MIVFAVAVGLLLAAGTILDPVLIAYQVKTIARTSCNQAMREVRYNMWGTNTSAWEKEFVLKVQRDTKIRLEKDWYKFEIEGADNPQGDLYCNATITFPTKTPWLVISDFTDVPPYQSVKTAKIIRQRAAAGF
jgi:hypothetical protein